MASAPRAEGTAPRRDPRFRLLRTRRASILGWMMVLVALTLGGTTGATAFVLEAQLAERVDGRLAQEVSEFRSLATSHTELTGPGGLDVAGLLNFALRANLPDEHQSFLALVDGKPIGDAVGAAAALAQDAALLEALAAPQKPTYGDANIDNGHIRYVAIPINTRNAGPHGTFVVAAFPGREEDEIVHAIRTDAVVGIAALILAAGVGWLFAGRLLAPLRRLRDTAHSITESDLTKRIDVQGHDEIADLEATFNDMLDRLEDAFATQRQFVDDASHELRTPITIIRGNLELIGDDPRERQQTIALVTDELDRMSRIVTDLLTLATARRPDFLHTTEVELAEFVEEVYAKAGALAPRDWKLRLPPSTRSVLVRADRHRLIQAAIQLAQNATQHTEEGAPIWIGANVTEDTARIWVRDSGPGIPPDQQTHIFERFARAAPSRRSGGAGLGLAIIKAIAEAHHGRIGVRSGSGRGATFMLELPVAGHRVTAASDLVHLR